MNGDKESYVWVAICITNMKAAHIRKAILKNNFILNDSQTDQILRIIEGDTILNKEDYVNIEEQVESLILNMVDNAKYVAKARKLSSNNLLLNEDQVNRIIEIMEEE